VRSVAYIIGPYSAPSNFEMATNVQRAILLGSYALSRGYCPIVPHLNPGMCALALAPRQPAGGADGIARGAADGPGLAGFLSRALGPSDAVWVIARPDGSLSPGTAAEYGFFGPDIPRTVRTWDAWQDEMIARGLAVPVRKGAAQGDPDIVIDRWPGDSDGFELRIIDGTARMVYNTSLEEDPVFAQFVRQVIRLVQSLVPANVEGPVPDDFEVFATWTGVEGGEE